VREFGYPGSYRGVVRYLRRRFGGPLVRALRRVETPPGVQAQHDGFEMPTFLAGEWVRLPVLVGALSHSRARFAWLSREATQLAWHTGHLELFRRYGGVPLWVRIDHLKTGVARGAGPTAVLNRSYRVFARECGFEIDPCRPATGSDQGKAERSVRTAKDAFGELFRREWDELGSLQAALDEQAVALMRRLKCPVPGTTVEEALEAERLVLQPLPRMGEPFDVVVSRRVSRDCPGLL
jgi:transposase